VPFFVFSVESGTSTNTYYPSNYNLLGSTQLVSGSVGNLQSDDGNYMTFRSYSNYDFKFAESLEESSWNANTEYQDKVVLTFTPSISADYIVIATAELQGNCISPPDVKARLYNGISTWQELVYRVKDTTDWYPFSAVKRVHLPASSQTLKIQYAISQTTSSVKIRNARLYAFSLSSEYAESEAESTSTSTTWQDKVALTFTPSTSGDYLIIATANLGGSSTYSSTLVQLIQDGSIVHAGPIKEPSTSGARYTFGVMRKINLDAASHTFKIQYRTESTGKTAYIGYAHIVAIRIDQFSNNYYAESETESGPVSPNTWYDKVTNTYTAQAADHLIIGSILYKAGSQSYSVGLNLLQGGTAAQEPLVEHKDSTDYEACFMMTKASLSAGSVTDKMQYKGESTSARVKNARLISLQLPIQHTVEVEFTGSSNTDDWTQFAWVVDSAWTTPSVTVTLQLYDYNLGQYPTSGDGYISYTSSATANTDETKSQTITINPTYFRDGSGNWKIKVKGIKSTATQFDFKGDLIKFEVTYTLPPVNNPPVAYDQSVTTAEDTPKGITLTASDPDSDPLTYFIVTGPSHGSLSGSPPSVTYTPNLNYNGADSFTFKAYDGQAYSNVATVSITVTPVNDPPVVGNIPDVTFPEDGSDSSIDLDDYVSDVDNTDAEMTWTFTGDVNIIVSIDSGTRVVTFTAPTNWFGQETITFRATDPSGLWDEDATTVTVTPVNDPPVASNLAISPTSPVTEDDLIGSYTYYDVDGDLESGSEIRWYEDDVLQSAFNDLLTVPSSATAKGQVWYFTVKPKDGTSFGALQTSPPVTIQNSPPTAPVVDVTPDFPLTTDDLTCTVVVPSTDPDGDTVTYTYEWYKNDVLQPGLTTTTTALSVTIDSSNTHKGEVWKCIVTPHGSDGPPDEDQVVILNSPPSIEGVNITPDPAYTDDTLTATPYGWSDADADSEGYTYQWQKWNGASWQDISGETSSTLSSDNFVKGDQIKVICTPFDGEDYGASEEDTIIISNSPPVLAYIGPKPVDEGTMLSFTAAASDPDVPSQTLTFSLGPGVPSGASITSGGYFTWTPTEAQGPGSYVIRIIVSDGIDEDYEDITVTVNEVNLPPVLSLIGSKTINEGDLLQFTITASDSDLPAQTLAYLASNLPPGATFNPTTRVFSWQPTSGQAGVYPSVHFEVSDGDLTDSEDITITVTAPPLEVSISPTSASISVGQSVTFTSTPSGGYPPYSYQWYLNGAPVSEATSSTWKFTSTTSGVYYVYLQVKDDNNTTQSETAKITVIPSVPVGGYSISLAKRTPTSQIAAYTLLIALFGAALSLRKRKRK
jgi:hypothetical protein